MTQNAGWARRFKAVTCNCVIAEQVLKAAPVQIVPLIYLSGVTNRDAFIAGRELASSMWLEQANKQGKELKSCLI